MAKTKVPKTKARRPAKTAKRTTAHRARRSRPAAAPIEPAKRTADRTRRSTTAAAAIEPVRGATRSDVGGVRLEIGRAGAARVKRVVYPAGFRWSVDMKPAVGTDLCMHGHVGFLVNGAIRIEYPDGCALELVAPQVVAIEPGHDGAVIGDAPAVLIELDFERATVERLGLPPAHRHV